MIRADEFNSIIEPYFDGGDSYTGHHKYSYIMQYESSGSISLSQQWDSGNIKIGANGKGSISRNIYKSDISLYNSVTLKMTCPKEIKIKLFFDNTPVLETFGTGKLDLYKAPVNKNSVECIKYEIINESEHESEISLYYLGVSRENETQIPLYDGEWEGCIEQNISFIPYNDDVMTRDKANEILKKLDTEPYKSIYEAQRITAQKAMEDIPEKHISKMISECFRGKMNFCGEIEALSFVGMVEKNADMIKMACRYALSLAACTYWGCDIMEEIPVCVWHHRSFNEGCACGSLATAISLVGNSLTWHGRNILYQALIMKGLPRLEADFMTMDYIYKMNQGISFMSGYIKALVALSHEYPRYEKRLDEAEELFLEMLDYAMNPDGSTNEGAGYWQYTFINVISCVAALSKRRNGIKNDILEKLKKTSDFGLFMLDSSAKTLPVNDCSSSYYIPYMCKYFYTVTGDERWAYVYNQSDITLLGMDNILMPVDIPKVSPVMHKEFEAFNDAGLVAVCRDGIRLICVSGDSNETHCHADKGSFLLYFKDKQLLCDRGTLRYDMAGANLVKDSEFHNCAVPVVDGKALSQKRADGLRADYKYEYKNGIFTWTSDQTMLWDSSLVKKNIRTIYSENKDEFIITDKFKFTTPTAVSINFHRADETSVDISTISEYKDIQYHVDDKIHRLSYITNEALNISFTTKIKVITGE